MRRMFAPLGALLLALATLTVPQAPPAHAVPAPWTWVRVSDQIDVEPFGFYSIREFCPSGYSAITGGLHLPQFSKLRRNAEFRFDDEAGSSWFVAFENTSEFSGTARVVAECVRTTDLPALSHNYAEFTVNEINLASGTVNCLNPGEVVVTGGVDWSNVNTRFIYRSGPLASGDGWSAYGYNSVDGAKLGIEVYCVDPSQVPGFTLVERTQSGTNQWIGSVTCPLGTRILNGGTDGADVHGSWPDLHQWWATGAGSNPTMIRAWCVAAGDPTITLTSASPGPDGALTAENLALFAFAGTDPAGFPNGFRCRYDDEPFFDCGSSTGQSFGSGEHELDVYNRTADGRISNVITYHWTVDLDPPLVTMPPLPKVSLGNPVRAAWTGTDPIAGVASYDVAYWRGRPDGTTTGWLRPAAWTGRTSATVNLPTINAGETMCVSVRARDTLGNRSEWIAPRCTSRPYDDRALVTSAGWVRDTGSPYWLDTITRTGQLGQTLRRGNLSLRQVGVLASRCPGCGAVRVAVAGATIGEVSLDSTTTRHQQVLLLPAFPLKTGTVLLTSITSGKSIRVDGLAVIRATASTPPP